MEARTTRHSVGAARRHRLAAAGRKATAADLAERSTPLEGTGTVTRRSVLTEYATRAGFRSVEVLPIEDFALRLYPLLN